MRRKWPQRSLWTAQAERRALKLSGHGPPEPLVIVPVVRRALKLCGHGPPEPLVIVPVVRRALKLCGHGPPKPLVIVPVVRRALKLRLLDLRLGHLVQGRPPDGRSATCPEQQSDRLWRQAPLGMTTNRPTSGAALIQQSEAQILISTIRQCHPHTAPSLALNIMP